MPVVSCPSCNAKVQIEDHDVGYDVECPYCQKVFPGKVSRSSSPPPARRPDPEPEDTDPYAFGDKPMKPKMPRRPSGSRYDDDNDEDDRYDYRPRRRSRYEDDYRSDEEVIEDAKAAVFMPAIINIIISIIALLFHIADLAFILLNPQAMKNNPFGGGPPPAMEVVIGGKIFIFLCIFITLAGTFSMMRLKNRTLAMIAMVMQILPCSGLCCILGLPFGIWGIVALNKPEVTEGFELVARER